MTALLRHEEITTSVAKGREAGRLFEKLVTLGKRNTVPARRQAFQVLCDRTLVKLLFDEVAPRYANRKGGYVRLLRLARRAGDGAELALLSMVEKKPVAALREKAKKEKAKGEAPKAKRPEAPARAGEAPAEPVAAAPKAKEAAKAREEKKPAKGKGFLSGIRNLFRSKRDREET